MCGIAAILLYPGDRPVEQWQAIKQTFSMNLILNEQRGTAATGIAVIDAGGRVALHKSPLPASLFTKTTGYERILSCVGAQTSLILGHTRLPTKGDPNKDPNNHPIWTGTVVGVHNGAIKNDDELFDLWGYERTADVDSEIIFRLVGSADPASSPRKYLDTLGQRIQLVKGEFTFLACDQRRPEHIVVAKHANPLWIYFHRQWNALIFSSRYVFLRKAFAGSVLAESLPQDVLMLFDARLLPQLGCTPKTALPMYL